MAVNYFDEAFESKNTRKRKSAESWENVDRGLRLALQNRKPSTAKSKGITPNARHLMEVFLWEACGEQSVSIEFRNKEEIAARAGLWRSEAREAMEELRENGLIAYDDTSKHKVTILIQRHVQFWKYPERVDLETLAIIRTGFRFDADPQERPLEYQGVIMPGFEPNLRETQYRNARDAAVRQIEKPEETPSNGFSGFEAARRAASGKLSEAELDSIERESKSKEFPSISPKAKETPSDSLAPLSFKNGIIKSAFSNVPALKVAVQSDDETEAMDAFAHLLGEAWETNPTWPKGDGAKWRNRWRDVSLREKTRRVMATLVEDQNDPGFKLKKSWAATAEDHWKRFR